MSKSITIKIPPHTIKEYEACFETKGSQRMHLYQAITERMNKALGDVFQKRICVIHTVVDGKPVQTPMTFDELDFDNVVCPSDPKWTSKDLQGKLEDYSYEVGDKFFKKITDYCRLFFLHNTLHHDSLVEDMEKTLAKKIEEKAKPEEIKAIKINLENTKKAQKEMLEQTCMESMVFPLMSVPIFEKLVAYEKAELDKEFRELNKEAKPLRN